MQRSGNLYVPVQEDDGTGIVTASATVTSSIRCAYVDYPPGSAIKADQQLHGIYNTFAAALLSDVAAAVELFFSFDGTTWYDTGSGGTGTGGPPLIEVSQEPYYAPYWQAIATNTSGSDSSVFHFWTILGTS